jgi:hypothetical protein
VSEARSRIRRLSGRTPNPWPVRAARLPGIVGKPRPACPAGAFLG